MKQNFQGWPRKNNVEYPGVLLLGVAEFPKDLIQFFVEFPRVELCFIWKFLIPVFQTFFISGITQLKTPSRTGIAQTRHHLFWYLYIVNFEHRYFTPCSTVSIVNFKHVIASWAGAPKSAVAYRYQPSTSTS